MNYDRYDPDFVEAEKAMRGSISHWIDNVNNPSEATTGRSACSLCGVYNTRIFKKGEDPRGIDCNGCPVRQFTGKRFCNGTPYVKIETASPCSLPEIYKEELAFLVKVYAWMLEGNYKPFKPEEKRKIVETRRVLLRMNNSGETYMELRKVEEAIPSGTLAWSIVKLGVGDFQADAGKLLE